MNYSPLLINKAEALIHLARGDKKLCAGGTYLQRVITNYLFAGQNAGSRELKKLCFFMSKKAAELYHRVEFSEFHDLTTNEHQEPLIQNWNWLIQNIDNVTAVRLLDRLIIFPMVVITKEENSSLNKMGYRSKGEPDERFRAASIEIVDRPD